ncbi:MAG: hypothetical protein ACLF0P_03465 [Thermoanaerobaculia bacterium]
MAAVYHALPARDRERAVIFAENYGRAGAIDYWADELGLPGAISSHNNYWLWGPAGSKGEVVIVLGGETEELREQFASVEIAGRADCPWCIPYERDLPIHVARDLELPMDQVWPEIRHYR